VLGGRYTEQFIYFLVVLDDVVGELLYTDHVAGLELSDTPAPILQLFRTSHTRQLDLTLLIAIFVLGSEPGVMLYEACGRCGCQEGEIITTLKLSF